MPMQIMHGDRELMTSCIGGAQLIVAPEEGIDDKHLGLLWRQKRLRPQPLAVLNPPNEVPKDFLPIKGNFLLFEENARFKDGIPAAWVKWAKTNSVEVVPMRSAPVEYTVKYLTGGMQGVQFTRDAAEWYARVVGTSLLRIQNEHDKLRMLGIDKIGLDRAVEIIGGTEEMKAERINRTLGTAEACKLALLVDPKRAIPLMGYLNKSLEMRRSGWWLALQVIKKAGMDKRFDFWTGVQIFAHYCYQANQPKVSEMDLLLDLMVTCGITPWYQKET